MDELKAMRAYTSIETAAYLRIDAKGVKNVKESIRYLRRTGQLRGTWIAGKFHYLGRDIIAYINAGRNS